MDPIQIVISFMQQIFAFMNIELHIGKYTFTLMEAMYISILSCILGYLFGSFIRSHRKD